MSIEEILIFVLVIAVAVLTFLLIKLQKKVNEIPLIKSNQIVNEQIDALRKEIGDLKVFRAQTNDYLKFVGSQLKKTIQDIETVRFNPFKNNGVGGNQSFATALLNNEGNGLIMSSLYSRDKVSVFAKPIKNWACEYEMTEEEKQVLQMAKERRKNN